MDWDAIRALARVNGLMLYVSDRYAVPFRRDGNRVYVADSKAGRMAVVDTLLPPLRRVSPLHLCEAAAQS